MTTKEKGDVYTPEHIVEHVLDIAGYRESNDILDKKIIDPSCGDGAFLTVIAKRLISASKFAGLEDADIANLVCENISGIEIMEAEAEKCRANITNICSELGISVAPSALDIVAADTLEEYPKRENAYDFVVGNPPYVRIHNLENADLVQSFAYCEKGMTDLYLAFYELGQKLCRDTGSLCYITPSSWFSSKSGGAMRADLLANKKLSVVVDLGHYQPFEKITTYTAIVKIVPDSTHDAISFSMFDEYLASKQSDEEKNTALTDIPYDEAWMNGMFVPIPSPEMRNKVRAAMTFSPKDSSIFVKNGFATNLDRFYIRKSFDDEDKSPEPSWIRDIAKSSTAKWTKCFYPYDKNARLLPLATFKGYSIYDELLANKEALLARNQVDEKAWWGYARSQGISDVEKDKIAMNTLYRDKRDLKLVPVAAGKCVYGGVYVLGMEESEVKKACSSDVFMEYVRALRKYKSGGYYTLGGKELERFLRWWSNDN